VICVNEDDGYTHRYDAWVVWRGWCVMCMSSIGMSLMSWVIDVKQVDRNIHRSASYLFHMPLMTCLLWYASYDSYLFHICVYTYRLSYSLYDGYEVWRVCDDLVFGGPHGFMYTCSTREAAALDLYAKHVYVCIHSFVHTNTHHNIRCSHTEHIIEYLIALAKLRQW